MFIMTFESLNCDEKSTFKKATNIIFYNNEKISDPNTVFQKHVSVLINTHFYKRVLIKFHAFDECGKNKKIGCT